MTADRRFLLKEKEEKKEQNQITRKQKTPIALTGQESKNET